MKRNAITLCCGAICIVSVIGPTKPGEDMNGAVYAIALLGSAGMLVAGMSLVFRVISTLEKENVELRKELENVAQKSSEG